MKNRIAPLIALAVLLPTAPVAYAEEPVTVLVAADTRKESRRAPTEEEALALAGEGDISVVGGAEIYELFMPWATRIELTEVHEDTVGDVSMPYPGPEWIETAREERAADGRWPPHSFVTLERAG